MAELVTLEEQREQLEKVKQLERKLYRKPLLAFFIGLVLLLLVFNTTGIVSTVVGIAGILLIVVGLTLFVSYFDMFYKIKGQLKAEMEGREFKESQIVVPRWFKKWGGGVLLFILTLGIGVFGVQHENDFGGTRFVWHSMLAGAVVGFVIFNLFKFARPQLTLNHEKTLEIGFYFIAAFIYLFVVFGPLVNRHLGDDPIVCRKGEMLDKDRGKYIRVRIDGREERFKPSMSMRDELVGKDSVELCVRKGGLGYDYVHEFRLVP